MPREPTLISARALRLAYLREQLEGRSAEFALDLARRHAPELSAKSGSTDGPPDYSLLKMLDHVAQSDTGAMLDVLDQMPVRERQLAADDIWEHNLLDDVEILGRALPWPSAERWERLADTYVGYLPGELACCRGRGGAVVDEIR